MLIWNYWPVPTGGAENQCRRLSHILARDGVSCTVLTARLVSETSFRENDARVEIFRVFVPQTLINRILVWRKKICKRKHAKVKITASSAENPEKLYSKSDFLGKIVRWANSFFFMVGATAWLFLHRREIDIIHVHIADWLSGYAGWIGTYLRLPVICKASNMPVFPLLDKSIPFYRKWSKCREKVYYVAMHQAIRDELIKSGVSAEKTWIIPNGVEIPSETAIPAQSKRILFVGNFSQGSAHKGFDILLKAWPKVSSAFPDARLIMVGSGDNSEWKRLTELANCSDSVLFTGYVQNVSDFYKNAALFVLPSRHEGMSNALLEAQSWGLPAVASDIPGNRVVVVPGDTGVIVPVGDVAALVHALVELLNDTRKRYTMGVKARNRMQEHFSLSSVAEKYQELYKRLIYN